MADYQKTDSWFRKAAMAVAGKHWPSRKPRPSRINRQSFPGIQRRARIEKLRQSGLSENEIKQIIGD